MEKVFNNRDIATIFNRHFEHVEDILNLSAVCSITYSRSWSQRMSEPYDMAARIRIRFGVIVPAEDAFTTFRKRYLQNDTFCLGGCGQEKDKFVSSKLASQQRCCEFCFHVRVNDRRIRAVCGNACAQCATPKAKTVCGACQKIAYCGQTCANAHWQEHNCK
jgi:hypothetical protein